MPTSREDTLMSLNVFFRVATYRAACVAAFVLAISANGALVAQTTAPASNGVVDITLRYSDGTQQRFVEAGQASTPAPPPASNNPTPPPEDAPEGNGPLPPGNPSRSLMGVNLEAMRDYSRSNVFIDTIKTSRRFGSPDKPWYGSEKIPVDENGWPESDFGVVVFTEAVNANGVYRLSCIGRCTIDTIASPAKVRNVQYDERTNRTLAEVAYSSDPDKPSNLFLSFTDTDGGVKNLKVLRPGYDGDFQIFTTEFLHAVEPFDTLRFMDWLSTNNSTLSEWKDRPEAIDAQFARGAPYELAIALGNRTKNDVWLHVPALASDDFVTQLATLVKDQLDPSLRCYIEYSNEVWNGIFDQYDQNFEAAQREVEAGDKTLNDGGRESNKYYWAFRRVGKRTVEIGRIFDRVFGRDEPRIRMMLCGQNVNTRVLEESLEWVEKYAGGEVKDHIHGIAVAPYFGNKKEVMNSEGLTVDRITEVMLERTTAGNNHHVTDHHALAKKYGVKSMAYEAGVDLGQFRKSIDAKIQAQFDPRAGQAVETYLSNWFDSGGDLLMYYHLCGQYSRSGYWGLTDRIERLDAPKYQAAARAAKEFRTSD